MQQAYVLEKTHEELDLTTVLSELLVVEQRLNRLQQDNGGDATLYFAKGNTVFRGGYNDRERGNFHGKDDMKFNKSYSGGAYNGRPRRSCREDEEADIEDDEEEDDKTCYYCGRPGHFKRDCLKKKAKKFYKIHDCCGSDSNSRHQR